MVPPVQGADKERTAKAKVQDEEAKRARVRSRGGRGNGHSGLSYFTALVAG